MNARFRQAVLSLLLPLTAFFSPLSAADPAAAITTALRAQKYQEALNLARSARRDAPADIRLLVLEGMALAGLGQDAEALADFSHALKLSPDSVPALEAAIQIEYKAGNAAATAHLERLLVLRPGEPTAHAMLAALAWKRGDCASAAQHFGHARPAIAPQPEALREFGACLIKLKRAEEAVPVFRQLLALQPEARPARYALAAAQLDAKHFAEAIETLGPLTTAQPPDPSALELASSAHEASGDTPQAVALLRQAVILDPGNVNLYLDFASLSFTHASFQVGIDMINAGLTQAPGSAALYLARGVLYVQLAQFDKADADFDRAERLDPRQAMGSAVRGLSQIQQNNLDQALVTVRSQLKSAPENEFLHYVLAELLTRQGAPPGSPEFREALAAALEAVRLKPDFFLARDVLSRLYLQTGEVDRAIEQCRLALRDNPSDEMALYRLIRALQNSGRKEAAQEVPGLLKRFTALREESRQRESEENKYRLVEEKSQKK